MKKLVVFILLLAFVAPSQYLMHRRIAFRGGSNSPIPDTPLIWLKPETLEAAYTQGQNISIWEDTMGNYDFTNDESARQPKFHDNVFNGYGVAYMGGTQYGLSNAPLHSLMDPADAAATIFVCFNDSRGSAQTGNAFGYTRWDSTSFWNVGYQPTGMRINQGSQWLGGAQYGTNLVVLTWRLTSANVLNGYFNATNVIVNQTATSTLNGSVIDHAFLGGGYWDGSWSGWSMQGYMAEFIYYDRALDNTETLQVINYLRDKFAITQ